MRVLIILSLLGVALAVPRHVTRIVGGEDTTIENHPFMSNMEYALWGIFWTKSCGGALITSRTVLSAAHCFLDNDPSYWRVRLGSTNATSGGSIHNVSELVLHPQFNSATFDNDVGIVRLTNPAVFSNLVAVARIAGPNYNLPDGTTVTSIGWGALSSGGPSPEVLQRVDVNLINQQLCAERYAFLKSQPGFGYIPDITDGMLCAGILDVGGKNACQGDDGGPLVHDSNIVIGVTSWRYRCADEFYPGVNARVSHYADWIAAEGAS